MLDSSHDLPRRNVLETITGEPEFGSPSTIGRQYESRTYIYIYMYASRGKDITFEENRLASDAYYPLPLTAELPILVFSTGALNIGAFTGTV